MTANLRAVVLRGEDWREHDRRLVFYTRERGKLEVLARGIRKIESKLAAHLEPFVTTEVFIVTGRRGPIVAGSVVGAYRLRLRETVERLAAAGAVAHLTERLTPLESKDERIFDLLHTALTLIDGSEISPADLERLVYLYVWKLVGYCGYRPELRRCLECRRSAAGGTVLFHPRRGGIRHGQCAVGAGEAASWPISLEALKGLSYMVSAPLTDSFRLAGRPSAFAEMYQAIERIIEEWFEFEARGRLRGLGYRLS